jgi:putative hydrolase of the HAD superfamily
MIKAVVFDLDDTLYIEKQYALSGFKEVSNWLFRNNGIEFFYETCKIIFDQGIRGNIFNLSLTFIEDTCL